MEKSSWKQTCLWALTSQIKSLDVAVRPSGQQLSVGNDAEGHQEDAPGGRRAACGVAPLLVGTRAR
jgi:hypothetical protein